VPSGLALAGAAWTVLLVSAIMLGFKGSDMLVVGITATLMVAAMTGTVVSLANGLLREEPSPEPHAATQEATQSNGATKAFPAARLVDGNVDIFRGLTPSQVSAVAALGTVIRRAGGATLGAEGEEGRHIFVILSGKAQLTAESRIGEMTIRIAEAGESLPLAALLGDGKLITTIKAMTDIEALSIPSARLMELCRERPDIAASLYANVAGILANRYKATLAHFTASAEHAASSSALWANV